MVSSNFRGVHTPSRLGRRKRFLAKIGHCGELIYIGSFDTEVQAALAYDKKALELKGSRAILNFSSSKERFASSLIIGNEARALREQKARAKRKDRDKLYGRKEMCKVFVSQTPEWMRHLPVPRQQKQTAMWI